MITTIFRVNSLFIGFIFAQCVRSFNQFPCPQVNSLSAYSSASFDLYLGFGYFLDLIAVGRTLWVETLFGSRWHSYSTLIGDSLFAMAAAQPKMLFYSSKIDS